jgi:RHS repeat-associated protein
LTYDKNGNIQTLRRQGKHGSSSDLNMDNFTYRYDPMLPNRLAHLNDDVSYSNNYDSDIDDQGVWNSSLTAQATWNNEYDAAGQLIVDKQAGLRYNYNGLGLVERIEKKYGTVYADYVEFEYDNGGLRNRKITKDSSGNEIKSIWYVRDASGVEVANYEQVAEQPTYPILADARLGQYNRSTDARIYEMMDHLGNVRSTFSRNHSGELTIHSFADYYPFGSPLPGRQQISSPSYEHGYQGQFTTKDEETGLDAFELRMWDSRLARWTSTDPYGQYHSPYLGMGNNPVSQVDPDGGWSPAGAAIGVGVGAAAGYVGAALAGVDKGDRWKYAVGGALLGGTAGGLFGNQIANAFEKNSVGSATNRKINRADKIAQTPFDGTKLVRETFTLNLTDVTRVPGGIGWFTGFRSLTSAIAALTSTSNPTKILKDIFDATGDVDYRLDFSAPFNNSNNMHQGSNGNYYFNVDGGGSETLNGGDGTVNKVPKYKNADPIRGGSSTIDFRIPRNPNCDCYDGRIRIRVRYRVPTSYKK